MKRCQGCGQENPKRADKCTRCGAPFGDWNESYYLAVFLILLIGGFIGVWSLAAISPQLAANAAVAVGLVVAALDIPRICRARSNRVGLSIFALVKMLLVVVVLAVLTPVYNPRHSEAARKSTCQSHLKFLGSAISRYCSDFDDKLPSSFLCGGSKKWNEEDFTMFAAQRGYIPPAEGSASHTWPMAISNYFATDEEIDYVWCPSDPGRCRKPSACVSYYWKAAVDRAWYAGYQRVSSFAFPSDQILLYEHNSWHWGQAKEGLTEGVTINCLLLDGHVHSKKIRNSGYKLSESLPGPLPISGIGEPAWFNYSQGSTPPKESKAQNWDPKIWADRLP